MTKTESIKVFRDYLRKELEPKYKGYLSEGKEKLDRATKIGGNSECHVAIDTIATDYFQIHAYGPISLCDDDRIKDLEAELGKMPGIKRTKVGSSDVGKRKGSTGRGHIIDITLDLKYSALSSDADDSKKKLMKAVLTKILDAFKDEMKPGKGGGQRKRNSRKSLEFPYNLIVFGAPGTGKSKHLEKLRNEAWKVIKDGDDEEIVSSPTPIDGAPRAFEDDKFERVTFYPTYSYAQFVGTYKPVMDKDQIAYRFDPGPFLNLLAKALKDPEHNYLLIIEEINRANAAAVFGDMFQLLDRGDDGMSEYGIAVPEDVKKWLDDQKVKASHVDGQDAQEGAVAWDGVKLRIPENFYIWATMNSADQGVFPLDTAFKRRWDFEYLDVDKDGPNIWIETGSGAYRWKQLRKAINDRLLSAGKVNEDKLLGPWFLKGKDGENISYKKFSSKVLMYLWEDAARMCRKQFFADDIAKFSDLNKSWERAQGLPGEDGSTFSNVFQIQNVKDLAFKKKISQNDLGNDLKVAQKKNENGSPAVKDEKPLFEVKFKEEVLSEIKDFEIESVEGESSLVKINIHCDACYGCIRFNVGTNKVEAPQDATSATMEDATETALGKTGGPQEPKAEAKPN